MARVFGDKELKNIREVFRIAQARKTAKAMKRVIARMEAEA
jgi:hypothetical protein